MLQPVDDPDDGLFRLLCLDDDLEFVVAAPPTFFPDYEFEVDDEVADRLGLADAADHGQLLMLVMVTIGEPVQESTANLLAPVVINGETREGAQVVLTGTDLPLRRLLMGG